MRRKIDMCGNEADEDINIASGNTAKISLFNIENDFIGLEKVIALFFPSYRHEMILRYRAETIAKIGLEAYKLAKDENIQINPIPPKIALPIIEKMSLEHEEDMYEKWANLLIAASVKHDPIHQQYAEILANLNYHSANLLKEIYTKQTDPNMEERFENYMNSLRFEEQYKQINNEIKNQNIGKSEKRELLPDARISHIRFPYTMTFTDKYRNDYSISTIEDINMLMGLERLGLIKYTLVLHYREKDKNSELIDFYKYNMLLTKFCYSFVDCLEHPTRKI
jgi:hypothetical protein